MPANILCVAELQRGQLDDATWELLGAARRVGGEGARVELALIGAGVTPLAEAAAAFDAVRVFDDERLALPDGGLWDALLVALVKRESYGLVLLAHTNPVLDLAPGLAVRLGAPLLADCLSLEAATDGGYSALRAVYGGKVHARVKSVPAAVTVATLRGGAFAAGSATGGGGEVVSESLPPDLAIRRRTVRTVEPEAGAVDISQADILVGVGRGIEEEENLELVQSLAEALGAEIACSRPVVDKGWLPKSRQVGTSGVTVKPRVYVAVGISGSFQHVGGIKGSPFLVAINKDAKAPIFGVADVGIVGDLFDVVPALEEKIREMKG